MCGSSNDNRWVNNKGYKMNWLSVKDYADVNKISTQAVYKRLKNGNILDDRIRINDGGKKEILLVGLEDLKQEK